MAMRGAMPMFWAPKRSGRTTWHLAQLETRLRRR